MNRRLFVSAIAAGAVGASAGCLSDIIDDVTTFEAEPVRVSEDAAEEAGYEYQGTVERVEEREYAGQDVEATNYISEYTRPIELPMDAFEGEVDAGIFAVISTPQIHVAGEDFNPVGDMSEAEIADYVQNEYEELEIGSNVGGRAILDDEIDDFTADINFETFEGTATLQGETEVDVLVDIDADIDHEDDHLVVIAVYPDVEGLTDEETEEERIDTLVRGLEHGEDVEVDIVDDDGADGDSEGGDGADGNGDEENDSGNGEENGGDEGDAEGDSENGSDGDADEDA